jgi:hypothetical protein
MLKKMVDNLYLQYCVYVSDATSSKRSKRTCHLLFDGSVHNVYKACDWSELSGCGEQTEFAGSTSGLLAAWWQHNDCERFIVEFNGHQGLQAIFISLIYYGATGNLSSHTQLRVSKPCMWRTEGGRQGLLTLDAG